MFKWFVDDLWRSSLTTKTSAKGLQMQVISWRDYAPEDIHRAWKVRVIYNIWFQIGERVLQGWERKRLD